MEHPGDDWPSLRRGGEPSLRRDKELYVTRNSPSSWPLPLSSYLRFHGIKMLKAAVSPALTYALISRFNGRLVQ